MSKIDNNSIVKSKILFLIFLMIGTLCANHVVAEVSEYGSVPGSSPVGLAHGVQSGPVSVEPENHEQLNLQKADGENSIDTKMSAYGEPQAEGKRERKNKIAIIAPKQPHLFRVAVVKVSNETKEKELNNLLVTQGVSHLLSQALYDTGIYVPLERNSEITERVNSFKGELTAGNDQVFHSDDVGPDFKNCDVTASVSIKKFEKSRLRGFLGPFSAAKVTINVAVEVTMQEKDGSRLVALGEGEGTTKSKGMLFQIREDKVHFDQTSAGHAMSEAVHHAVAQLLNMRKG